MAVPKKRTRAGRRDSRRSHHALVPAATIACPNCKTMILPHHACDNCGTYRGKQITA